MTDVEVNTDIRNKILLFLYDRYYDGEFHDFQITEQVISQIGISGNQIEIAHRNINYLEKAGYIYGETPLGSPVPKWIKIQHLGIDFVERLQPSANIHWNIRFEILSSLYKQYFSGENEGRLAVNPSLVESLKSIESNKNVIFGNVIYLRNNNFISGEYYLGFSYPPWISIDVLGIQTIERIMNESLNQISRADIDSQEKKELEDIVHEFDKKTKFEKFYNWFKENTSVVEFVINVAKSFPSGG